MKKILVTTDLSSESKVAFPIARAMAQAFEAKLGLLLVSQELYAVPTSFGLEAPVYFDPNMQREMDERLRKDLETVKGSELPGPNVEVLFKRVPASVVDGILEVAVAEHADLLVMASHGRSGVRRMLIGSITERVMRAAPCPVLVVPTKH